jgi:hypothetical protein
MGFCSQFKALLKKNVILWYRHLCGSLCELLFPLVIMSLIVLIRSTTTNQNVEEASYANNTNAAYYFDENTRFSLGGQKSQGPGPYPGNPFTSCAWLNRLVIGYTGDSKLYPGLLSSLLNQSTGGKALLQVCSPRDGLERQLGQPHPSADEEVRR